MVNDYARFQAAVEDPQAQQWQRCSPGGLICVVVGLAVVRSDKELPLMTDGKLRGIVLKKFYDLRNQPGMLNAVELPELQAIEPDQYRLHRICEQLTERGLIKAISLNTLTSFGSMGNITALGVDVIEGNDRTPILLPIVMSQEVKATASQSKFVQPKALRLLKAIYDKTHDQTNPVDDVTTLSTGLSEEEAKAAWRYLRDRGLIQTFNLDYAARINGNGIDVIENSSSPVQQANTPSTPDQAPAHDDRGSSINRTSVAMGGREQVASGIKAPMSRTILFLSSNPTDTGRLRLDKEVREITEGLKRSNERDRFTLLSIFATRVADLRRNLLDHSPQIVHFAGHDGTDGIVVENDKGEAFQVPNDALAELFGLCADQIECVILNACYSAVQVDAIVKHIPYVIGMTGSVSDAAAIEFAIGFYDALGAGRSIEVAFQFGRNAVALKGIPEHLIPVLKKNAGAVRGVSPGGNTPDGAMVPKHPEFDRLRRELSVAGQVREFSAALVKIRSWLLETQEALDRNRGFFDKWCQFGWLQLNAMDGAILPGGEFWTAAKCAELLRDLETIVW